MEEILNILLSYSSELILISFLVFILSLVAHMMLKKIKEKVKNPKRELISFISKIIPIMLSFGIATVYSGLSNNVWFSREIVDNTIKSWILSLSLYLVVSKLCIVIKNVLMGKTTLDSIYTEDMIEEIKQEMKEISIQLNSDKESLEIAKKSLDKLIKVRKKLSVKEDADFERINSLNFEIKNLESQKKSLNEKIILEKKQIDEFNQNLKNKQK